MSEQNSCQEVKRSANLVAQLATHVTINRLEIAPFVKKVEEKFATNKVCFDKWSDWHLKDISKYTIEQIIAYVFCVDAMNFCFWPGNIAGEYEYENMTRNLEYLLDNDPDFFTPQRFSTVQASLIQVRIFEGRDFALLEERARILRQIGSFLIKKGISFHNFVAAHNFNCDELVRGIIDSFPGFRDQAIYKGHQVFFYKRAQILVADLIGAFDDYHSEQSFTNCESLTMFADYRVPQILRELSILNYSDQLALLVDSETELEYSSEYEVEIRALTIVAVEEILVEINNSKALKGEIKYAYQVDWLLWQMGEAQMQSMRPHHKVLSIYY